MKLPLAASFVLSLVVPPESGGRSWLFDDVESTGRVSAHALSWVVLGDDLLGGASSAVLETVPGGANAPGHALRVTGSVAEAPSAFTGVWAPLDAAGRPVDLGAFDALRFFARGEGGFRVGLRSGPPTSMANFMAPFTAGPEWKAVEIGFDALVATGPGSSGAHWEPREVHWLGFSTAPGAQGRFRLELDDVQLVSRRAGVAALPVTQPGTPPVISVALAEPPAQSTWRELARDPAGDGKMPSLPEAVSVSVTTDAPDGRIWFRVGLRETPCASWLGLNLALDVDGDPADGTPWWGVNTGFRFDRLVSVWLFKTGSGYQAVAGTADAAAVAKGDFMAGERDLRVAVDRGSPAFLVGVPRSVLGAGTGVLRFVAAVGSALAHNDDLPDTGAVVLPR